MMDLRRKPLAQKPLIALLNASKTSGLRYGIRHARLQKRGVSYEQHPCQCPKVAYSSLYRCVRTGRVLVLLEAQRSNPASHERRVTSVFDGSG